MCFYLVNRYLLLKLTLATGCFAYAGLKTKSGKTFRVYFDFKDYVSKKPRGARIPATGRIEQQKFPLAPNSEVAPPKETRTVSPARERTKRREKRVIQRLASGSMPSRPIAKTASEKLITSVRLHGWPSASVSTIVKNVRGVVPTLCSVGQITSRLRFRR